MYRIPPTMLNKMEHFITGKWNTGELEMLRSLNRVKFESNKYMDKGNALEKCVKDKCCYADGHSFPRIIIDDLHERTKGAVWQQYIEGLIQTGRGEVLLYGYIDCVLPDKLTDLKWVKQYKGRKFFDNHQHTTYLHCAREQGIDVDQFEYLVTDEKEIYTEVYAYSEHHPQLVWICEQLIDFAEKHKKLILNPKFFGEEIESERQS